MSAKTIWLLRILMGWLFLWAFLDKLLGLGFATCRDTKTGVVTYLCKEAWLKGGSPTAGFLETMVRGPFASYFHSLFGDPITNWVFMVALAVAGFTLLFGVFVRLGSLVGVLIVLAIYAASSIWPANNPFLDQYLIYAVVLIGLAEAHPGWLRWRS